jgi:two-component system sensor kinase FixL
MAHDADQVETQDRRALFAALLSATSDAILVVDSNGTILEFNHAAGRLLQTPASLAGANLFALFPDLRNSNKLPCEVLREIAHDGGHDRAARSGLLSVSVHEYDDRAQSGFVVVFHEALAREKSHLAAIVQSSDDIILSKTLDGRVLTWNPSAERIFGYSAVEMIGNSIAAIIPKDRLAEEDEILRRVRAGERVDHYETVRRCKDGSEIQVSLTVSPIRDASGTIVGASKIARDISAERRAQAMAASLQAELLHVSRLSAMGQMSAAIAHELNQPLTASLNYIKAVRRMLKNQGLSHPDRVFEVIDKGTAQIQRAGAIIRNLRGFVEKRESQRSEQSLNEVIDEAVALAFVNAPQTDVKLERHLETGLPSVLIDRVQMQQVFVNLIRNAVEAMANSPIRVLSIKTVREDADHVVATVIDTGPGLPAKITEQLFQPFITTKEQGMGIGLSICKSIVEVQGGEIGLVPDLKTGAGFWIRLAVAPRSDGP